MQPWPLSGLGMVLPDPREPQGFSVSLRCPVLAIIILAHPSVALGQWLLHPLSIWFAKLKQWKIQVNGSENS